MKKLTAQFESLPLWAKLVIIVISGGLASAIYRIIRYTETKNTTTLIVGVVSIFFIGIVFAILDILTELTDNKIKFLAD